MGVPGFFSWLRRKYPQIVDECANHGQQEDGREDRACDNLYIGQYGSPVSVTRFFRLRGLHMRNPTRPDDMR